MRSNPGPDGFLRTRVKVFIASVRHGGGMLLGAAAVLLAVAAVLPPVPLSRAIVNHLVVFDISQSMYVADQTLDDRAVTRLARARGAVITALQDLPCGSQIGLGIFASRRTLLLLAPIEVCGNRVELEQAINQIDVRMAWEDASVIVRGLYTATDVAFELAQRPSVIFITDGHESPPMATIPPFERPLGRTRGMIIGVGGATPQPIPKLDKEGRQTGWWSPGEVVQRPTPTGFSANQEHLSSLHEGHLQALAQTTGLGYGRLGTDAALKKILIDPGLTRELVVATDVRWIPALLAALLLTIHYLRLPSGWLAASRTLRWRRTPARSYY